MRLVRRSLALLALALAVHVAAAAPSSSQTHPGANGLIAFSALVGDRPQVFVAEAGGRRVRRLTSGRATHSGPSWSADGRTLVYARLGAMSSAGSFRSDVLARDVASGRTEVLFREPRASQGDLVHALLDPSLSPDEGRIAITNPGWEVQVVELPARAPRWDGFVTGAEPAWSPNGRWIAFTRLRVGPNPDGTYLTSLGIWRMRPDGRGLRRITRGDDWAPSWAPDGRRIVFARRSRSGTRSDVLVASPQGRGVRRLTEGSSPAWSPDGTRIAFVAAGGIGTIRPAGTGRTLLVRRVRVFDLAWQPRLVRARSA